MPIADLAVVRLHYLQFPCQDSLEPPPCGDLVLIHGLAANLGFWQLPIVRPLSRLCNLTLYDLRGHGRSEAPAHGYSPLIMATDLARLLDHLALEKVHLLAHSFGGAIAMAFAALWPERVRSLILADVRLRAIQPQHRLRDWPHWPQWQPLFERAGILVDDESPESGYELLVEMARSHIHNPAAHAHLPRLFSRNTSGARRNGVAQRWLHLQENTSIRQEFLGADGLTPARLATLHQPMLGLYGALSPVLPSGRALRRLCPNYRMRVIPNAGHFFPLTKPLRLVRSSLRFLAAQADLPLTIANMPDLLARDHSESHSALATF